MGNKVIQTNFKKLSRQIMRCVATNVFQKITGYFRVPYLELDLVS